MPKQLNKKERESIWMKYDKHCAYCGKDILYKEMQVDHLFPRLNGMVPDELCEKWDNYMPSCRRCNHYKRANPLPVFRDMLKTIHERVMKQYISKVAADYGVLEIKPFDGRFYFERIVEEERQGVK